MTPSDSGKMHALLVGIDNYEDSSLSGCVNDIQKVAAFLTERLQVPKLSIRKIVAPRSEAQRPADADAQPPTHANLVSALQELAGPQVQRGDRVFIHYSGHGSFQKMPDAEAYFEGLVPLDYEKCGLLFDVEMNGLLQAIADRSGDLSVVLDCCHSAGATRAVGLEMDGAQARFIAIDRAAPVRPLVGALPQAQMKTGAEASKESTAYSVLAACHADETAAECRMPPRVGEVHGLLTSCLFDMLSKVDQEALSTLRWSDIWESLKDRVLKVNPSQRPQFLGPKERRVFGGPWQPQDTGYAVRRSPDGSYSVAGGSLAGLGRGAQIAVYGAEPALFPALNSAADHAARLGVLVVETLNPAQSTARPTNKDAPFEIPAVTRGRLIKQGAPGLLLVAVGANLDPKVRSVLDGNQQWDKFLLLPELDATAEAHVGQYPDGDLWIGDDLNGPGAPFEPASPGPMGRVRRSDAEYPEDMANGLRAGLNHYAQYVIPLRTYRNGGFTLPPEKIEVRLLDCNDKSKLEQLERNASLRTEVRRDERGRYRIKTGDAIAIHVQNAMSIELYLFLLLCNLEGQIEFLDGDVTVKARSGKIFWSENENGKPFYLEAPNGFGWGIDRLIVIATDQKGMDLSMLAQRETLDDVIREAMSTRNLRNQAKNPTSLRWVASQTLIQIEDTPRISNT